MNPAGLQEKYVEDTDFVLYLGDVREQLRNLPAESVHCVVTSPPYWGLRDYGTGVWDGGDPGCDHAERMARNDSARLDAGLGGGHGGGTTVNTSIQFRHDCGKCGARRVDQQLGLEPTPDLYVQNMVDVFREVRRVLRRDGTCWLNIGDSYGANNTGGSGAQDRLDPAHTPNAWANHRESSKQGVSNLRHPTKPKDLVGIPWRLAFALQHDGWYLRADVIWSKPNPMPESVTDRPTKAHEYLFLLTRSPRYFYDADAIREDYGDNTHTGKARNGGNKLQHYRNNNNPAANLGFRRGEPRPHAGRNRRSVWEIATEPYPDAHFATFPQALVEPCVLAGTSERGCCPECGAPWERETTISHVDTRPGGNGRRDGEGFRESGVRVMASGRRMEKHTETTGWRPTCDCHDENCWVACPHTFSPDQSVPCTVLDPFMGSGTTALVARRLGRKAIGVELNEEYARLCAHRLRQLSLLA